jgi:hypothetical protein
MVEVIMNDLKLIIRLVSIFIACVVYVGIWYWIYDNRDEYLYISYPKGFDERFLSMFSQIWCVIHIVGAIGAIIWAWC